MTPSLRSWAVVHKYNKQVIACYPRGLSREEDISDKRTPACQWGKKGPGLSVVAGTELSPPTVTHRAWGISFLFRDPSLQGRQVQDPKFQHGKEFQNEPIQSWACVCQKKLQYHFKHEGKGEVVFGGLWAFQRRVPLDPFLQWLKVRSWDFLSSLLSACNLQGLKVDGFPFVDKVVMCIYDGYCPDLDMKGKC